MCGIAGFIDVRASMNTDKLISTAKKMSMAIQHRGPDDSGEWTDADAGIALSHRRLSILDLSPEGHQPMVSASGRYVIVYNGEIYNFKEIRSELERKDTSFRGQSDTETMLVAIEEWGLEAALNRFVGMFAFALWDKKTRTLRLVRDRMGIKPVYYGRVKNCFVFGSELRALKAFPGFENRINRSALALMMRHSTVPAPYSIYEDIHKLLPGTILTLNERNIDSWEVTTWWSMKTVAENGVANRIDSREEAIDSTEKLLEDSIRLRMVADVPLGAFLSGGYDSSLVVALMQAQSSARVKTFTIGFHEEAYNEAHDALKIAQHLGTDHTELYVTGDDVMSVIPEIPTIYDEPFSDPSQVPTYLVSKLAREHVTVSLSGDGGDEVFAGYYRYTWGHSIWNRIKWLPVGVRTIAARLLSSVSPDRWDNTLNTLCRVLPARFDVHLPGEKIHKLAGIVESVDEDDLYHRLMSNWKNPTDLVIGANELLTAFTDPSRKASFSTSPEKEMFTDSISYLPDHNLTKVDRASMAVGLEAREPLLDHRLVELAWRLPLDLKIRDDKSKWILKHILHKYVPEEIMDRPKMGFGIPIDKWLRGPLREWAGDLLNESRLRQEGYFDATTIQNKLQEHLSGSHGWHRQLWDVLMFQSWLEKQ